MNLKEKKKIPRKVDKNPYISDLLFVKKYINVKTKENNV